MAKIEEIVENSPGRTLLLLGNEAIARGALEAGIGVATTYPGTPSSEIGDVLAEASKLLGFYMEYSVNEKVAFETAAGAALSGVKSLVCMKHVGLNVASDALMSLSYTGVRAGMVIVSADDPNCWSSQNEQDNRYYSLFSGVPLLEPSDPQEAKDLTVEAFRISEILEEPIILRTTTRISHTRGNVKLGRLNKFVTQGKFERDFKRFLVLPANARVLHRVLLEKIRKARNISENFEYNRIEGKGDLGIITSGISYCYVKDVLDFLDFDAEILKLSFTNPLPERLVTRFLRSHDRIIVVEELEPFLETQIMELAFREGIKVEILGKKKGVFPRAGEYTPRIVLEGICKALSIQLPKEIDQSLAEYESVKTKIPPRIPSLCPGCPHRSVFFTIKKVLGKSPIYPTDIGCYTLGAYPPYEIGDTCLCMGAGIGLANGLSLVNKNLVVAFAGDSTFFHACIPALINAVYNAHDIVFVILENEVTAMTGHQPHPSTGRKANGSSAKIVKIEEIAKACGADYVTVVNAYDPEEIEKELRKIKEMSGVRVLIARGLCALIRIKTEKVKKYRVISDKCRGCGICYNQLGCTAIDVVNGKALINEDLCTGCGVCQKICPFEAIIEVK